MSYLLSDTARRHISQHIRFEYTDHTAHLHVQVWQDRAQFSKTKLSKIHLVSTRQCYEQSAGIYGIR